MTDDPEKHDEKIPVTDRLEGGNIPKQSEEKSPDQPVTDRLPTDTSVTDRFPDRPVTDRLPESSVTDRLEAEPVTDILGQLSIPTPELMSALGLKRGDLIADRYRVEEGPLGGAKGGS